MEIICMNFYSTLYDKWFFSEKIIKMHNKILNSIELSFISKLNHELEHPITKEKLRLVILEMDVGKALGPNWHAPKSQVRPKVGLGF